MKVFVIDAHSIYRCGLAVSLAKLAEVSSVAEAQSIEEAWEHPDLPDADLLLIDHDLPGGRDFIRKAHAAMGTPIVVCSSARDEDGVLASIRAGAVGCLCKDTLTHDTLAAGVRAADEGAGVMEPELLGTILRSISRASQEILEPNGMSRARLTAREQQVLRLIADGHPTREVAEELAYSERTVKNVLHDAVTKMNARSRSQAVALAVREGLI
ncbi:MAG: response regulator transcription factor [Actinomycetota bacterium]|nr:response regulator transcription factor [Actinomycetota bacterium]